MFNFFKFQTFQKDLLCLTLLSGLPVIFHSHLFYHHHHQQQHQQQQQQQQQQQHPKERETPLRWREKETELQHRLTERERQIARLKEQLRDLTKKLRQQDDTKVFISVFFVRLLSFRAAMSSFRSLIRLRPMHKWVPFPLAWMNLPKFRSDSITLG